VTEGVEGKMQDTYKAATGTGWITFAAILFLITGTFHVIDGISALSKAHVFSQRQFGGGEGLFANLTFWGIVLLIIGGLALYAGYALLSGSGGRGVGIFLASLGIIAQLMFITAQPWWALVMIAMWFMIIYALIVRGEEAPA
jgi:hypothetical protein